MYTYIVHGMLAKNRQRHAKKYAFKVKLNVYLKYHDTCMLTNVCLQCINKYMLTMYWTMYTYKILANVIITMLTTT